jgi:hypothetical protein
MSIIQTLSDVNAPVTASLSQAAAALLQFQGKPLGFTEYEPFKDIYDYAPNTLVIKAGRQIGKSLSLAAIFLTNSIMRSYFNTLYLAPLQQQASRFSTAYIDPFLRSPLVKKYFIDGTSRKNVFEKSMRNGSIIYIGYCETESDADRIRGIANIGILNCDEFQDMSMDALPILRETTSASDYGFVRLTGTAKGENNSLEIVWKRSSMSEWVMKCDHCSRYTVPIDFDNCSKMMKGKDGPACIHCGKTLDVRKGQWMAAKPDRSDNIGFHCPQLIFHARTKPEKWKNLVEKFETYPASKLANEVYGLAAGVGGRILSLRECMACCNSERTSWDTEFPTDDRRILYTTLGVDWSVSGSDKSYTVISIFGHDSKGKTYLLYCQRLNGVDILEQVARVEHLYRQFRCTMLASDRGVGVLQAQLLQRALGKDQANMIQYVAAKHPLRWDRIGSFFSADRTMAMDHMIIKAKLGRDKFETPAWSLTGEFWQDALNVFEEETQAGRRVYRKDEDLTDDSLHSWVFADVASQILRQEFTYLDEVPDTQEGRLEFL